MVDVHLAPWDAVEAVERGIGQRFEVKVVG